MLYSYGTIIVDKSNKSILCLRAYANWDFPKGQQDEGEEGISTAVRETKEETGLIRGVDYEIDENEKVSTEKYGSGKKAKIATYFLAKRLSDKNPILPINPELGKAEHDEWKWVPFDEVEEKLKSKRYEPILNYLGKSVFGNPSIEQHQESKKLKDVYNFVKE